MEKIPVLDLAPEIERHWDEFNQAIQAVLKSTRFINGPEVGLFESEVASYLGAKHAIGLNSGTDGLFIGLRALGIKPGDEVITTAFTFFATAEAISLIGATPVFVDVDEETFNIDPSLIEEKITPKTKAILPVHLFGHAANMDEIMALAKKYELGVLEDVAQAFSGTFNGNHLGTIGHLGSYSFFPSKNLGAFGDGGLLVTNQDHVAEAARMLRSHGSKKKYFNEFVGYNSRLDTIQAAILRVKLPHIDEASEGRRRVASRYAEMLGGVEGLIVPAEKAYARHVFHQYTTRIPGGRREAVRAALSAQEIETMIYYPTPLHRLPVYQNMNCRLPVSERLAEEVLSFPIWPEMSIDKQLRVVNAVKSALSLV